MISYELSPDAQKDLREVARYTGNKLFSYFFEMKGVPFRRSLLPLNSRRSYCTISKCTIMDTGIFNATSPHRR